VITSVNSVQGLAMAAPSKRSQTADRQGVYAFCPPKAWSYRTEVHQMFKGCNQIIADKPVKIISMILKSIFKCQGDK